MSKTPSINLNYVFKGLIVVSLIWLIVVAGLLFQTIIQMNKIVQLNSLPVSPQQIAIQKALETIESQTIDLDNSE